MKPDIKILSSFFFLGLVVSIVLSFSVFQNTEAPPLGITCQQLDTSRIPISPYTGYFYNDGSKRILSGSYQSESTFRMLQNDSCSFGICIKLILPYKPAYIAGTGLPNWVISVGSNHYGYIELYNPVMGWKDIFYIGTNDSARYNIFFKWTRKDSTLKCYVNDFLTNTYTSYLWPASYTGQPFTLFHGNASAPGALPADNLFFRGAIYNARLHKYFNGSDSAHVYNFNNNSQVIIDSSNYGITSAADYSDNTNKNLTNGVVVAQDTADVAFSQGNDYKSLVSPLGSGLMSIGGSGYWIQSQIWGFNRFTDSMLVCVGTFNRINANYLSPGSGTVCNYTAAYNIRRGTWSPLGAGANSYPEKTIQYRQSMVAIGNFTAMGSMNAAHIAEWNGISWNPLGTGINNNGRALYVWGDSLYAGGIFNSAGGVVANNIAKWNGSTWTPLGGGVDNEVEDMCVYNNKLILVGRFGNANGSTARGIVEWNGSGYRNIGNVNTGDIIYTCCVYNNELYIGGNFNAINGIPCNIAAWNGSTWRAVASVSGYQHRIMASCVYRGVLYAGGEFNKVNGNYCGNIFKTDGSVLCPVNYGSDLEIWQLVNIKDSVLYMGGKMYNTDGVPVNNICSYISTDPIITNINISGQTGIPQQFSLYQNYPNPFNPETKIKFDIPAMTPPLKGAGGMMVSLIVYDILGREAASLVNENLHPGSYEISWNASNFSSGIYFYVINAESFTDSKKMVLIK